MGVSAAVMMVGSGVISAYGQNQAGKINQRMANLNAELSEQNADDAIERGAEEAGEVRKRTKQIIGRQRAVMGASGVDVNRDSAAEVQADTQLQGELDALTVRQNAVREAWGYKTQGVDYRMRGSVSRATGQAQATGTLLSSGSQAYYSRYGRQ